LGIAGLEVGEAAAEDAVVELGAEEDQSPTERRESNSGYS
jgi:hypothetical protein